MRTLGINSREDEASLELGYMPEQFVAQAPAWIEALRADAGRNVAVVRVVARRKPRQTAR